MNLYHLQVLRFDRSLDQPLSFNNDMLILTRRSGQTIFIGDEVRLTVLGIKGDQVRIGIEAPDAVAVHREEIYDRVQAEAAGDRGSPE